MKYLRTIYLIICITFFVLIVSCNRTIVINHEKTEHVDYVVTKQNVNFLFNDSIYPFTVLIKPNGTFSFNDNFQDSLYFDNYITSFVNKKIFVTRFVSHKDSLINLKSYFPKLITNDSSVINHYDNPEDFDFKLSYELYYSYLLNLTNEPLLSSKKNIQEIRVTSPYESLDIFDKPKTMYTIRLKILSNNSQLFLTEGIFDSLGIFNITRKDSCIVKDGDIFEIKKAMQKIDFKKEYYFAELGLEIQDSFLFEYTNEDEYYSLERALQNRYRPNRNILDVYYILWSMKNNYFKNK